MSGMIPHHAQAVLIAGWAASHGARKDVAILCERIVVGQRDEIQFMRNWLRDRGQAVPAATPTHHKMKMPSMVHDMLMPGMLTERSSRRSTRRAARSSTACSSRHDQAPRGRADDGGRRSSKSYGAVQDDDVFKFASDVYADQTTEIEFMKQMLAGRGIRSEETYNGVHDEESVLAARSRAGVSSVAWPEIQSDLRSAVDAGDAGGSAADRRRRTAAAPTPPRRHSRAAGRRRTPRRRGRRAGAAAGPGGRGGRGRGTPPPPPPPPPAVMPAPVTPIVSATPPDAGSARRPQGWLLGRRRRPRGTSS